MVTFCEGNGVAFEICGKVIVAGDDSERARLIALAKRARVNDVRAIFLGPEQLRELQPHAASIGALHVPEAGIVDFPAVCRALADLVERAGVQIRMSCEVKKLNETASAVVLESTRAQAIRADGSLVDDFVIARTGRNVTVLSAPSPAATASLVIGEQIASYAIALL